MFVGLITTLYYILECAMALTWSLDFDFFKMVNIRCICRNFDFRALTQLKLVPPRILCDTMIRHFVFFKQIARPPHTFPVGHPTAPIRCNMQIDPQLQ